MLILYLLSQREYYIGELTAALSEKRHRILNIVFPYAAIYRLLDDGFIQELKKRIAPDGRRRQYYTITPAGREYLQELLNTYQRFTYGVANVMLEESQQEE